MFEHIDKRSNSEQINIEMLKQTTHLFQHFIEAGEDAPSCFEVGRGIGLWKDLTNGCVEGLDDCLVREEVPVGEQGVDLVGNMDKRV